MGIFSELLFQLLFLFQSAIGGSMITTDKVFSDPQVAQLANAALDGDLARIQQLIERYPLLRLTTTSMGPLAKLKMPEIPKQPKVPNAQHS